MARVELRGLAHSYLPGPRQPSDFALRETNHVWEDGGAYALLGPSGCGKTTLLNIISGLLTPTAGRVLFDGRDVTALPTEQRHIAQVFQFPVVYDTMSVYANLAFPLRNQGVAAQETDRRVREMAELLELTGILDRKAHRLGEDVKQKISLGRGLIRSDVAAMLFDEPLTVIDPHLKWQLRRQLRNLHKRFNITMVYVTHDQTEALTFADKVVVMYAGEVVQVGTPRELFERPQHTFVGYFIGSPGMNVVPCSLQGDKALVEGRQIQLPGHFDDLHGLAGTELGIRPEFIRLRDTGGLPVQLRQVRDMGRHRIVVAALDGLEFNVVVPEDQPLPVGRAGIDFDTRHIGIFADGHRVEGVNH